MSMLVQLQRPIEVCALLDGALAVVGYAAAPEDGLAFVICGFQFQPCIVGIHSAARKEVPDGAGARYHIDSHRISPPDYTLHAVQWRSYRHDFIVGNGCCFGFCFFSDRKCSGELSLW